MRRYETIFITDNDLSEEDRSSIFEKLRELIHQHDGLLVLIDEWGSKKLAYEIRKKPRGYYVRLDYCGLGILVNEIERFFRIDDRILKYMTVLLDKDVDVESVKEEIAKAEEAKSHQEEPSDAPAEPSEQIDETADDLPGAASDIDASEPGEPESEAVEK